jgi:acyl-CoA synthetase (AMP-forming)/AMP-acid ligase II
MAPARGNGAIAEFNGRETLQTRLERTAATAPDKGLVFVDRHEHETFISWADVFARGAAVAGGLRALGVGPGDTVAVVAPTGPAFFDAFFGASLAGAVPVPLYPPTRLGRLDEYQARTAAMLTAARVRLVVAEQRTRRALDDTVRRAQPELGCIDIGEITGPAVVHAARPGDIAMVQFSSGTVVDPKPVALTHANLFANVSAMRTRFIEAGADVSAHGVSWLPLYHDMGLIGSVFIALYHPGSLTLIPPELFVARPALWLRALSRTHANISAAPNFAYALCTDRVPDEEMEGVDLGDWRVALNGAEPVSAVTLRAFAARFARWGLRPEALMPVYGLSEATLAVTFSDGRTAFRTARVDRDALADKRVVPTEDGMEIVSVGRPLPGVEIAAAVDAVGPVRVRGASVMAGYLHQPERTAAAIVDGWLDTGDLGFLHDGELYISGRTRDVIILRGRNYAPHEIEQALDAVPDASPACAAAVGHRPEDGDEERLVVFVESREPGPGLAARCREAILRAATIDPALVVVLAGGTLPRTSSGKIRRGDALRRWLDGSLIPPESLAPELLAGEWATSVLERGRQHELASRAPSP